MKEFVMTKAKLRSRVRFEDIGVVGWGGSWHEPLENRFATNAMTCDECGNKIEKGELYSLGLREVYPDAPISCSDDGIVHIACLESKTTLDEQLKGQDITKIHGYIQLTPELKKKYSKISGTEISEEDLNKKGPFDGKVFVICGEFDESKRSLSSKIKEFGGQVSDSYKKNVTTILLGRDGKTDYGQPTGKKSKKYKDAKKAKRPVVDYAWMKQEIENFKNGTSENTKKRKNETDDEEKKKVKK